METVVKFILKHWPYFLALLVLLIVWQVWEYYKFAKGARAAGSAAGTAIGKVLAAPLNIIGGFIDLVTGYDEPSGEVAPLADTGFTFEMPKDRTGDPFGPDSAPHVFGEPYRDSIFGPYTNN
jgi:hypothetical protein